MLRFLSIKRLAVIDAVEVEFEPGLNVLTGETGAGKSILVEAVGLLLGGRASGDLVRTGEDVASIEAIFESGGEELHVRREITAQGRSRAFINGNLATALALRELSTRLIELHGQHEHQTLLDPSTHLGVLDAFGDLGTEAGEVATAFEALRASTEELARTQSAVAERSARQELLVFQLGELERAALTPGEDEALAATRSVLSNAERVERLCQESYAALYENEGAVLAELAGVWRRVTELATVDPRFQPFLDARANIKSQLEDLAQFLRRHADGIEASPERLQAIEERLALLERLKRKYGPTLPDVIARREALRQELADLEHGDERLAELQQRHSTIRAAYLHAAQSLATVRRKVGAEFPKRLEALLGELAMDGTVFAVRFGPDLEEPAWAAQGIDQVEFYVSPNPGEDLRPLARIVSGGELSRIMLAIKTLMAISRNGYRADDRRPPSTAAPGLIFDEVDAGIGGRVADVVGRKLRALGSAFQVLCITHLPQIAAYADTHFQIDKRVELGRTRTSVRRLNENARVEELSRMLGGAAVTDAVRASALEMLQRRHNSPSSKESNRPSVEQAKAKGESESPRKRSAGTRPQH